MFDPVREYEMSRAAASKLVECGYLKPVCETRARAAVHRELDADDRKLIVVTAGGGGDGFQLLKTYLDAVKIMPRRQDLASLVVTGPLMPKGKRELVASVARAEHVNLIEFTPDLVSYLAAADLVVSMAGYNAVCETLALGVRALFVPRVQPRVEQLLRAERLAQRGLARVLLPGALTPERLALEIECALAAPRARVTLDLRGLERTSRAIAEMLAPEFPTTDAPSSRVRAQNSNGKGKVTA